MKIESAKKVADTLNPDVDVCSITAVIDGVTMHVPLDPMNRHYAEIQEQVAAGTLTIEDPD
tara:strand:+ start:442 stop:624 length:183 start_codon:yes stop_codon:yes gene_type:complete